MRAASGSRAPDSLTARAPPGRPDHSNPEPSFLVPVDRPASGPPPQRGWTHRNGASGNPGRFTIDAIVESWASVPQLLERFPSVAVIRSGIEEGLAADEEGVWGVVLDEFDVPTIVHYALEPIS